VPDKFETIQQKIITRLQKELDPALIYHNVSHTLDVMKQVELIAKSEGVINRHELMLLKIAAAYHDSGFLFVYKNHEEKGCEIVRTDLSKILTGKDLDIICGIIMATKIPQLPNNLLEQIICDADLDYLGRDDFEPISQNLYKEFIHFGIIKKENDWDAIQIGFFEMHHYFTKTALSKRKKKKEKHLLQIKKRSGR